MFLEDDSRVNNGSYEGVVRLGLKMIILRSHHERLDQWSVKSWEKILRGDESENISKYNCPVRKWCVRRLSLQTLEHDMLSVWTLISSWTELFLTPSCISIGWWNWAGWNLSAEWFDFPDYSTLCSSCPDSLLVVSKWLLVRMIPKIPYSEMQYMYFTFSLSLYPLVRHWTWNVFVQTVFGVVNCSGLHLGTDY